MPRMKPYTEIGVRRLKCIRCESKAEYQWQICADDNVYRPICLNCDIELNELVLNWIGDPEVDAKMKAYRDLKHGGDADGDTGRRIGYC